MDSQSLRNFRDFLQQYNTIAEGCFHQCVYDLSSTGLSHEEASCVDRCSYKFVKTNNRAMQVYMEVQPEMTQRRIDEMNKTAVTAAQPTEPVTPVIVDSELTENVEPASIESTE